MTRKIIIQYSENSEWINQISQASLSENDELFLVFEEMPSKELRTLLNKKIGKFHSVHAQKRNINILLDNDDLITIEPRNPIVTLNDLQQLLEMHFDKNEEAVAASSSSAGLPIDNTHDKIAELMSSSSNFLFLTHHIESTDEKRFITVIDGYPFYCSTGNNSKSGGTYFPFCGLDISDFGKFLKPKNWFDIDHFPEEINGIFGNNIGKEPKKIIKDWTIFSDKSGFEPIRFGNFETMLISSELGGGFWDTEFGQSFKDYLNKTWPEEVNLIKNRNAEFFSHFNSIDKTNTHVIKSDLNNQINQLLAQHATRFLAREVTAADGITYVYPQDIDFTKQRLSTRPRQKEILLIKTYCSNYIDYLLDNFPKEKVEKKCQIILNIKNSIGLSFDKTEHFHRALSLFTQLQRIEQTPDNRERQYLKKIQQELETMGNLKRHLPAEHDSSSLATNPQILFNVTAKKKQKLIVIFWHDILNNSMGVLANAEKTKALFEKLHCEGHQIAIAARTTSPKEKQEILSILNHSLGEDRDYLTADHIFNPSEEMGDNRYQLLMQHVHRNELGNESTMKAYILTASNSVEKDLKEIGYHNIVRLPTSKNRLEIDGDNYLHVLEKQVMGRQAIEAKKPEEGINLSMGSSNK